MLLQTGQLLSNVGTQSTAIAYPLLVLALTHSPADAGIVASIRSLGQLPWVQLAGPPLGGALFGLGRALPFLADAGSYLASTASLLAMHTPFQEERRPDSAPMGRRVTEGFRFLWGHPYLRTTALLLGVGNFIGPGVLLALVVIGRRHGLSPGALGGLVATFGASVLLGAVISPLVRRALPPRSVLLLELWTATACGLFLLWPNVYVLAASIVPTALVIPSTDAVVHGYRIAMTPDRLLGRSESARLLMSLALSPLGPLAAGLLLEVSDRAAIALFAAVGLGV